MFADISKTTPSTFGTILSAATIVDTIVVFIIRFMPILFRNSSSIYIWKDANIWYNKFGLNAAIADILSITLGVLIGQNIYRYFVAPMLGWSIFAFLSVVVAFQFVHDIFFNLFVILPIPKGHNGMIDVFKAYAKSGKSGILFIDAGMMIATTLLSSFLYTQPAATTILSGSLMAYSLPYILTTRNKFSTV